MVSILKTPEFNEWVEGLRDKQAVRKITARVDRLALGNAGDVKPVGQGVSEMRIDFGPGYRVYYKQHGALVVVLLCGGDKSSQNRDIKKALELAAKI